jgi:hypothetical protein
MDWFGHGLVWACAALGYVQVCAGSGMGMYVLYIA